MSFLKKLLFEEEIVEDNSEDLANVESAMPDVEIELNKVNEESLIQDIYLQNNLSETSKSIFKVEELINSLPKEMMTEVKRNTVLSILASFGLTTTDVVVDGENRMEILNAVLEKITTECTNDIDVAKASIEDHKKQIADLEKLISTKQNEMKTSTESINGEVNKINGLISFTVGGEV